MRFSDKGGALSRMGAHFDALSAHFRSLARGRGKVLRVAIVPRAAPGDRRLIHGLAGAPRDATLRRDI